MRAVLVTSLLASLCPAVALAQTGAAPSPSAPTPSAPTEATTSARVRGGNITRDDYIERAKRNAEKRFDRLDTNHDGVLTPEERAAARSNRRSKSE